MTSTSTVAGLIPIMLSQGTGSEVTQRIAAPMVGGMVTVTVLSLLVLPVIYGLALQAATRMGKSDTSVMQPAERVS